MILEVDLEPRVAALAGEGDDVGEGVERAAGRSALLFQQRGIGLDGFRGDAAEFGLGLVRLGRLGREVEFVWCSALGRGPVRGGVERGAVVAARRRGAASGGLAGGCGAAQRGDDLVGCGKIGGIGETDQTPSRRRPAGSAPCRPPLCP